MRRRIFLQSLASLPGITAARAALRAETPYSQLYPDMYANYLARELNRLAAKRDRLRAGVISRADQDARNKFVRRELAAMIGVPIERNPVRARIVRVLKRNGYRIECLLFESHPDFWVSASLYVPEGKQGKMPAIISPCGHYEEARALPQYQAAYLSLVDSGFVVLAYDPIGQGERRLYWNPDTGVTEVGGSIYEHSMPGQLLTLLGKNLLAYFIADGMRAIDYLLTREEVDGEKIGCTGHSGGGTQTYLLSALDQRIRCAVVHEGGTKDRWPVHLQPYENIPHWDIEQNVFPSAIRGIDAVDIHAAIAPRWLMVTNEQATAPFAHAVHELKAAYTRLGVSKQFSSVVSDDPHAWTYRLRMATSDWFSRCFYQRPGPASEPEFRLEDAHDLWCSPKGSLRQAEIGHDIWAEIQMQARQAKRKRPNELRELLQWRPIDAIVPSRQTAVVEHKGYRVEKIELLVEPGVYVSAWVFVPTKRLRDSKPILYFNEAGKEADGMEFSNYESSGMRPGVLATLARRGYLVIAADVRGMGSTNPAHGPHREGTFSYLFNAQTACAYMAWYMDRSVVGMRVRDVIATLNYTMARKDAGHAQVNVIGKDAGALWVLIAAALDNRISNTVCEHGLLSYQALFENDRYLHSADHFIPGILQRFDLPEIAELCQGHTTLLGPVDGMKAPVSSKRAQELFANAIRANKLRVEMKVDAEDQAGQYIQLLTP